MTDVVIDRSCGPEGCEIDWLASPRVEVDADPVAFTKFATDAGWGDGLPLVPPTESRVREFVQASGRFPDDLLGAVPPRNGRATVEKVAVNAVMAGAPPAYWDELTEPQQAALLHPSHHTSTHHTTPHLITQVYQPHLEEV